MTEYLVGGAFVLTFGLAMLTISLRDPSTSNAGAWFGGLVTAAGLALLLPGAIAKGIQLARRDALREEGAAARHAQD